MGQFQLHIVLFCRLFFIFSFFRIYERSPNLFPSFSPHIVSLPPIPRSPVWRPSSAPPPPAQPSWTKWATASRSNWRSLGQIWGWWRLSRMGMGMGMRWWGGGDRGKGTGTGTRVMVVRYWVKYSWDDARFFSNVCWTLLLRCRYSRMSAAWP